METGDDPAREGGTSFGSWLSPSVLLRSTTAYVLDLIFPPSCVGCGKVGQSWCDRCASAVENVAPLHHLPHEPALSAVAATGLHEGRLREAVQALKYENVRSLAQFLGTRMAACLYSLNWSFDTLLPVPIGNDRLRERGYNQAGLIAAALAQEVGVAFQPSLIWRTRETRSQVGLTKAERQRNMLGAFSAHPSELRQRSVLLIDDVFTTGATLHACAIALRAVGAHEVYALTVTAAHHQ